MWEPQEATVFPQSCSTVTTRFQCFKLETLNQNNLGTSQGETGVQGVPASERARWRKFDTQSYKKWLTKIMQTILKCQYDFVKNDCLNKIVPEFKSLYS